MLFDIKNFSEHANNFKLSVEKKDKIKFLSLTKEVSYLFLKELLEEYFEVERNEDGFSIYFIGSKEERLDYEKKFMYDVKFNDNIFESYVEIGFNVIDNDKTEYRTTKVSYCEKEVVENVFSYEISYDNEDELKKNLIKYFENIDFFCYTIHNISDSNIRD